MVGGPARTRRGDNYIDSGFALCLKQAIATLTLMRLASGFVYNAWGTMPDLTGPLLAISWYGLLSQTDFLFRVQVCVD